MTSESKPLCKPGNGVEHYQPSVPSRSSPISQINFRADEPRTLEEADSAAPTARFPLPQRTLPSTTTRHSLVSGDRSPANPLKNGALGARRDSTRVHRRSASCSGPTRKSMHPTKLQRWSGLTRTVSDWDHGLRRVCELSPRFVRMC